MVPRNPRHILTDIMGNPEAPGLFKHHNSMLMAQFRFKFARYRTPKTLITPETAVGIWQEVISTINNCAELNDKDLELLNQFFCIFPNYFFTLRVELQNKLLSVIAKHYIVKAIAKIKSAGANVSSLLYMIMPALSEKQGAEIAKFYINLQIDNSEETVSCGMTLNKDVGAAISELREFISADDLQRYTDFLIDKLAGINGQAVVQEVVNMGWKFTPTQVITIFQLLHKVKLDKLGIALIHGVVRSLANVRIENSKPVMFDDVISEIIGKIIKNDDPTTLDTIEMERSIKAIKYNLSSNAIAALVGLYKENYDFRFLNILFDVLTIEQRKEIAKLYLSWLKSTNLNFVYYSNQTKSIEYIQIFKDYFDESLTVYVEQLIHPNTVTSSQVTNHILFLQDLIPFDLQRKIILIYVARLEAELVHKAGLVNYDLKEFYIVLQNLECLKDSELPEVLQIVFLVVEALHNDIPTTLIWKLKNFAIKNKIDIEAYLAQFLDKLFDRIKIPKINEYFPNYQHYQSLLSSLGTKKRRHQLIAKYCLELQLKFRSQETNVSNIEKLIWYVAQAYHVSDASKTLIAETIKIYFDSYEIGKHPMFSNICRYVSEMNQHQDDDILQQLLLEICFNMIISITAAEQQLSNDIYNRYLEPLYPALVKLHGKCVHEPILKYVTNRYQSTSVQAGPLEEKPEGFMVSNQISEYQSLLTFITQLIGTLQPGKERLQVLPLALDVIIHAIPILKNCSSLIKAIFTNQTLEESSFIRGYLLNSLANMQMGDSEKIQLQLIAQSYFFRTANSQLTQESLDLIHLVSDREDLAELKIIFSYAEISLKEAVLEKSSLPPELANGVISQLRATA
jgi:hypothetical protein